MVEVVSNVILVFAAFKADVAVPENVVAFIVFPEKEIFEST